MSRFVDEDWEAFRPATNPAPAAYTWATWLAEQRLTSASEAERLRRWANWLTNHTPSDALLRDLAARGLVDWMERVEPRFANAAASTKKSPNVRADPILLSNATFIEPLFNWTDDGNVSNGQGTITLVSAGIVLWETKVVDRKTALDWLTKNWARLAVEDHLPAFTRTATRHRFRLRRRPDFSLMSGARTDQSLFVWREGLFARLESATTTYMATWAALEDTLSTLGSFFAGMTEDDLPGLTSAWENRNFLDGKTSLSLAGVDGSSLPSAAAVLDEELIEANSAEWNELLAAARMSANARLSTPEVSRVLDAVASVGHGRLDLLDAATLDLWPYAQELEGLKDWAQGAFIARYMRGVLGLGLDEAFHPREWLESAGVDIRLVRLGTSQVDAISCWGTRRGPAVLLNSDGLHGQSERARRVTLAHEIGHLIMDRFSALPAAEVFSRGNHSSVERRANAFAAELLLPRSHAGAIFESSATEDETSALIELVSERFGVGGELIAWQVRNASRPLTPQARLALRDRVPIEDWASYDRGPSSPYTY